MVLASFLCMISGMSKHSIIKIEQQTPKGCQVDVSWGVYRTAVLRTYYDKHPNTRYGNKIENQASGEEEHRHGSELKADPKYLNLLAHGDGTFIDHQC